MVLLLFLGSSGLLFSLGLAKGGLLILCLAPLAGGIACGVAGVVVSVVGIVGVVCIVGVVGVVGVETG